MITFIKILLGLISIGLLTLISPFLFCILLVIFFLIEEGKLMKALVDTGTIIFGAYFLIFVFFFGYEN